MIDVDLDQVRVLCAAGDGAGALHELRWGATDDGLRCRPLSFDALAGMAWAEVHRMPTEGSDAVVNREAALSTLWAAGRPIALLVAAPADGPARLHLAIGGPEGVDRWTRGLLGPGFGIGQLESAPAGLAMVADADRRDQQRSLLLRLSPWQSLPAQSDSAGDDGRRPAAVPLLGRLLTLAARPSAALVVAVPLDRERLETARLSAEAAYDAARRQTSSTQQLDEHRSTTTSDPTMERAAGALELLVAQLHRARTSGGWAVHVLVGATTEADLTSIIAAAATSFPTPTGLRADRLADELVIDPGAASSGGSFLTLEELGAVLVAPHATMAGVEVLDPPPDAAVVLPVERPVDLGSLMGVGTPFVLDLRDLAAHVFVSGLTGSGKSTTLWRLLSQVYNRHNVPFLIIDPVKREHEGLAGALRSDLRTIRASELRLSALEPFPGFDRPTHLGLVSSAFRGCFALPTPVPYIVRLLFDRVLRLPPPVSLHDLASELGPLVDSLGYRGEADGNIRAALGARLAVLTEPSRAEQTCAPDSSQVQEMLRGPALVELSDCGDDDERAFLMALLAIYVTEAAKVRQSSELRHVTVLEEAHRILPEPSAKASGEVEGGDAASVVAQLLTQLLAEARSSGECVIVADQSPGAVARDVVRNTGLKIIHRIVDPEDRRVVGGAIGLPDERSAPIASLNPGEAIVAGQRLRSPHSILVTQVKSRAAADRVLLATTGRRPCCDGGWQHHRVEALGSEAEECVGLACAATVLGRPAKSDDRLAKLAALHRLPSCRCIAYVGLRRHLNRLLDLGVLDAAEAATLLADGFADHVEHSGFAEVARVLGPRQRRATQPFAGCASCGSSCCLRGLRGPGLDRPEARLRALVGRALPGQEAAMVVPWANQIRRDFTDDLGVASKDLALCVVLRVAAQQGLSTSVEHLLGERTPTS